MKTKILVIILFGFYSFSFAQSSGSVKWIAKFGAAGGFVSNIMFPDFAGINSTVNNFGIGNFEGPLVTWGGGGYAYIMLIDNFRIGGIGFGGSQSKDVVSNGFRKEVNYFTGGGGLTLEYTFPFIKNIAVSVGAIVGGGKVEIEFYKNKGEFTWDNIWKDFENNSSTNRNVYHKLTNNYFALAPTFNVDIPFSRFLAFRIGAGYRFSVGGKWTADNEQIIQNVPENINGNTFFIQTGLFIGLFAF